MQNRTSSLPIQLPSLLIAIALLIILLLLKTNLSPSSVSYFFWFNFFSCLQMVILLFAIMHLLVNLFFRRLSVVRSIGITFITVLLILSSLELFARHLLNNPEDIPRKFRNYFHDYYDGYDMSLFQYEPNCSVYDSTFFYSMRPLSCFMFSNREYSDSFYTDASGFREHSIDLVPDVVCLGDSYTMGYGVGQNKTVPSIIENLTGLKVLNTGMSSFGTAREVMTLSKRDLSQAKLILWQYCDNDVMENEEYIRDKFTLSVSSEKEYTRLQRVNEWRKKYFPSKHSMTLLKMIARGELGLKDRNKYVKPMDSLQQAQNFLTIIDHSQSIIGRKKIILFELGYYKQRSSFIESIKKLLVEDRFRHLSNIVVPIDIFPCLKKDDFFILDVHVKAEGNRKIAEYLKSTIVQCLREVDSTSILPAVSGAR